MGGKFRQMYIKVKATPGAKKESVLQKSTDTLEIKVREPAERNLANRRILELVARHFGVTTGKVRMVSGHHSQSKILSVDNVD